MAVKSRVASFLSKTRSSSKPPSVKRPSIDDLRSEKEDLEAKVDRLQDECTLHQKNAEEARVARTKAEEEAQLARQDQSKAEEEKRKAIEEKAKADEERAEAQRVAAEHAEEARKQASAAAASAVIAQEASEREKQAAIALLAAEQVSEEEKANREKAELAQAFTEQELAEAVKARDAAEAARDVALADAEKATAARVEAETDYQEEHQARIIAEAKCREAELVAETKIQEAEEAAAARERAMILFSQMEQGKLEAEQEAFSEKTARETAEVEMRVAEVLSENLADQLRELREEKEDLQVATQDIELTLSRAQEELVQVQKQISEAVDAKDNAELGLHESERRVEELTVLVQEWRERAEDARSMKEDFERALEKARDAQYDAQKQAEEYRRAKEKADAEKRGVERISQKLEAQAKKDREAALASISAKEEAERASRNQGIQPVAVPSEVQVDAIRKSRQFREGAFHVAVAGLTGTGKSSLVNALMGNVNGTPEAIPTGTHSTKSIGRHIDTRRNYPHIWYDIPGAGTLTAPSWNYFNDQALYVFDVILVVWDNCFTDVDIAVLENCVRLNKPVFIVRTKSDIHVSNIEDRMRDVLDADSTLTNKDRKARASIIPFSARAEYISETRQNIELSLHNANLPSMKVYLVAYKTIVKIVQGDKNMRNVRVIDEFDLLNDIWALRRGKSSIPRRSNTAPVV